MSVTKEFILAGKAVFTIDGPDKHRTFKVTFKKANGNFPDMYFVSTLTGPENTKDFTYMGILNPEFGQVRTTGKSDKWKNTFRFRLLNRVLLRIWSNDHAAYEAHGYKTHHEGKCGRCGHALTVPSSIESGFGPECIKYMGQAA